MEYPMPYASCLVSCSVVGSCSSSQLTCPVVLCLMQLSLSEDLIFCSLFYPVHICTVLLDSLSRLVHSGIACLASQAPWLGSCILGWPVWPVIGYPMIGAHPSMSIVRLIVIGYHCNCLDGQFNYQASAHWLISGATMYWLFDWWLCYPTALGWQVVSNKA